nr:beta-1,3-galactosyltransferase 7-like [Tanacetum cinerariifolium]
MGVTEQSCSGVVFNYFTGKFECSSSSQAPDKTAKQKEKSSFDAATVANKEAAAYNEFFGMVSNQPVQDQFRVPSLVTFDSPKLFESSSSQNVRILAQTDNNPAEKHTRRRKTFVVIEINTTFISRRRRNSVRETWMPRAVRRQSGHSISVDPEGFPEFHVSSSTSLSVSTQYKRQRMSVTFLVKNSWHDTLQAMVIAEIVTQ